MADRLVEYVQHRLVADRAPVEAIVELTDEVVKVLVASFDSRKGSWPYEIVTGLDGALESASGRSDYTFSTNAMIAYALQLAGGRIERSSLAPAVVRYPPREGDAARRAEIDRIIARLMGEIAKQSARLANPRLRSASSKRRLDAPHEPPLTISLTFGWDDPFTLTWLLEILATVDSPPQPFFSDLQKRAEDLVKRVLQSRYELDPNRQAPQPIRILQVKAAEDVEHAFPLLRVLQLRAALGRTRNDFANLGDIAGAREYLFNLMHRQLSESQLENGSFDPAELVFALEGWLLANDAEPDFEVVDRVFAVMAEQHERTPYWRPFKPFKATAQGLVLLPQSVEIANSLLRICARPALQQRRYFSKHQALLARYTDWVLGRRFNGSFSVSGAPHALVGWESEFTHRLDRIHLWQTSQALIYLQHYAAMLREHLAQHMLDLAGFQARTTVDGTPADTAKADSEWEDFKRTDPMNTAVATGSRYLVYEAIDRDFILP